MAEEDPINVFDLAKEKQRRNEKKKQEQDIPWHRKGKEGVVIANERANILLALKAFQVNMWLDEFSGKLHIENAKGLGPYLDDNGILRLRMMVHDNWHWLPDKNLFSDTVIDIAVTHKKHPVKEYLQGLVWDRKKRIGTWLVDYGGAENSEYVRAVGKLFFIAAVRRIMQPGCKFDEMMVLESSQGKNKSSALAILAIRDEWFCDDFSFSSGGKEAIEHIQGHWIIEASELKGMRNAEIEKIKSFLSRTVDQGRLSYARIVSILPRQCIFVGTTNANQYLKDETGNRRFWPIPITIFDLDRLMVDRDQLWAEAVAREAADEGIRLDSKLWAVAEKEQMLRVAEEPWTATLSELFGEMEGKVWSEEIWKVLGIPKGQRTQQHFERIGRSMRALGWDRKNISRKGMTCSHYVRGNRDEWKRIVVVEHESMNQFSSTIEYVAKYQEE